MGKLRSDLTFGVACLAFGFTLLIVRLMWAPVAPSDYTRVELVPDEVYLAQEHRHETVLWIESQDRRFKADGMFWRQSGYHADELLGAIAPGEPVTLWVKSPSSRVSTIRGIQSARVSAGPETGAAADNKNRAWMLAAALIFTVLGFFFVIGGRVAHPAAT